MSENASARVVGRPFAKGVSGNIHGEGITRVRADELYQTLSVDYPSLSPTGDALLRQACWLMALSRSTRRSPETAAKCAAEARQALALLKEGVELRKPALTTRERVAMALAELDQRQP